MPDMCMCADTRCPARNKCYRYRAVPNLTRQSYLDAKRPARAKDCDCFTKIEPGDMVGPADKESK